MATIRGVVLVLVLATPAWAQRQVKTGEPVSPAVAMIGTVVVGAGYGMMLHSRCPDRSCGSDTGWLIGGVVVVTAGVTMIYLGLRSKTVVVPVVSPQRLGAFAIVRWGK